MRLSRILAALAAFLLVAGACGGGGDTSLVAEPEPDPEVSLGPDSGDASSPTGPTQMTGDDPAEQLVDSSTEPDELPMADPTCAQSAAFPDDPEFGAAVCAMAAAQIALQAEGIELDPSWTARGAEAIFGHAADRDDALATVMDVTDEMLAAAPPAPGTATPPVAEAPAAAPVDSDQLVCTARHAQLWVALRSAGIDPANNSEWAAMIEQVDTYADAGDLDAANDLLCGLNEVMEAAL